MLQLILNLKLFYLPCVITRMTLRYISPGTYLARLLQLSALGSFALIDGITTLRLGELGILIFIEIDEHWHHSYLCRAEYTRMMDVNEMFKHGMCSGGLTACQRVNAERHWPRVFVRINSDKCCQQGTIIDEDGKLRRLALKNLFADPVLLNTLLQLDTANGEVTVLYVAYPHNRSGRPNGVDQRLIDAGRCFVLVIDPAVPGVVEIRQVT
jgi:hypothetical protein